MQVVNVNEKHRALEKDQTAQMTGISCEQLQCDFRRHISGTECRMGPELLLEPVWSDTSHREIWQVLLTQVHLLSAGLALTVTTLHHAE